MAFIDKQTILNITGVSEDDYEIDELSDFIMFAQREVLSQIQQSSIREPVEYLDETRKNEIDGSTTTFYLKNWKGNYLGDKEYDGDIDVNDVKVYSVDEDDIETELIPSSVDYKKMSFTLSSAPAKGSELFVTYAYTPYDLVLPHPLISQATAFLAASYLKLTEGGGSTMGGGDDARSIRIGNLSIGAGSTSSSAYTYGKVTSFYDKYRELMAQLLDNSTSSAIWGESFVKI
jgi:hypothetical protein